MQKETVQRMGEFQSRELTYEVDALDAMAGIFALSREHVKFLYGLPIGTRPMWLRNFLGYGADSFPFKSCNDAFASAMTWSKFAPLYKLPQLDVGWISLRRFNIFFYIKSY